MPLRAVNLTHVRYEHGDLLGKIFAWFSLLPVFIAFGGFPSLVFFRRELHTIFFCIGLALSEVLNQTLKRIIQLPRPATCHALETCDSHGMPSSHSQYMCFFAIYCSLSVVKRFKIFDSFSYYFSLFLPWPLAFVTMWSRIYLGYHSFPQVVAGSCVGLTMGTWWWWVVHSFLAPRFAVWSETRICQYLCIKDNSHVPNILEFEYRNSLAARKVLQEVDEDENTEEVKEGGSTQELKED